MADEKQTETTAETTEAKKPLQRNFIAIGPMKQVVITPKREKDETLVGKTLDVQFGKLETWREGEEKKVSGRFEVTYPRVVDGMEDHLKTLATKADAAIAAAIKLSGRGTVDDYTFDLDDEFFKQTFDAPKVDADDVWKNDKFKANREGLIELRSEAEDALSRAADAKEHAQEEAKALAGVLAKAYELVGKSRKALASWALGVEGAGNHPQLAKMGKGANALYEAMQFARITDAQYDVLPSSITSGKGLVLHKSRSINRMAEDVTIAVTWPEGCKTNSGTRLPNLEGLAAILRRVATKALGITGAGEMDLTQLGEAVNNAAATKAGEFIALYGKNVNTYDTDDYGEAMLAYGAVTISEGGENLFGDAVTKMLAAADLEAPKQTEAIVGLYNNNLLVKAAVDMCWKHKQTLQREGQNREVLKETEDEDGPISKTAAKSFGRLDALPAAAHLFKLLCSHPDAPGVWDSLKGLVSQQGIKKPAEGDKPMKEQDVEADQTDGDDEGEEEGEDE